MERDLALGLLKSHFAELEKFGVKSLALFGSTARGEATLKSDIDLLVEFSNPVTFDAYMNAKFFLEDLLGSQVDLVIKETLKPRLKPRIESEAIYVS